MHFSYKKQISTSSIDSHTSNNSSRTLRLSPYMWQSHKNSCEFRIINNFIPLFSRRAEDKQRQGLLNISMSAQFPLGKSWNGHGKIEREPIGNAHVHISSETLFWMRDHRKKDLGNWVNFRVHGRLYYFGRRWVGICTNFALQLIC